jgi:hypothetical protein
VSKNFLFILSIAFIVAVPSELLSRGGSSSSSSRSSSSSSSSRSSSSSSYSRPASSSNSYSSSYSSSKPTTSINRSAVVGSAVVGTAVVGTAVTSSPTSEKTAANNVNTRSVSQSSTIKNTPTQSLVSKPKAVSNNFMDKKQAKAVASQNNVAAKTYGSKANAEKAFRDKLSASNQYNTPTPPAVQPTNIPRTIIINNTSVPSSYGMLPGGHYGYGYYDPMTHVMVALAANQMMVNNSMMRESGYGQWDDSGRPIIVHESNPVTALIYFILIVGAVVLVVFIVKRF